MGQIADRVRLTEGRLYTVIIAFLLVMLLNSGDSHLLKRSDPSKSLPEHMRERLPL